MEMKLFVVEFYYSRIRSLFDGVLAVDACKRKGGIALCWNALVNVHIKSYSMNLNSNWGLICFYCETVKENRWRSWKLLEHLLVLSNPSVLL